MLHTTSLFKMMRDGFSGLYKIRCHFFRYGGRCRRLLPAHLSPRLLERYFRRRARRRLGFDDNRHTRRTTSSSYS